MVTAGQVAYVFNPGQGPRRSLGPGAIQGCSMSPAYTVIARVERKRKMLFIAVIGPQR
jgi:hypothetical protein